MTADEIQAFFRDLNEKTEGELSMVELDMVAGGKISSNAIATSIITFGVACAFVSIGFGSRCADTFQENTGQPKVSYD